MINAKTLCSCFLRSYFTGAAFNPRGLQNIGLLYAVEPALSRIYPNQELLLKARSRYMWHFNTHPLWVPLLVGMFLNLEQSVRKDMLPSQGMVALKNTACYTLSAIGDSVFSGSLIPLWGLIMCCLFIKGFTLTALLVLLCGVLGIQLFRVVTFIGGLRYGLGVIEKLSKFDIMLWGDRIKIINGCLIALLIYLIFPLPANGLDIFFPLLALFCAGWLIFRNKVPRFLVVIGLFFVLWGSNVAKLF